MLPTTAFIRVGRTLREDLSSSASLSSSSLLSHEFPQQQEESSEEETNHQNNHCKNNNYDDNINKNKYSPTKNQESITKSIDVDAANKEIGIKTSNQHYYSSRKNRISNCIICLLSSIITIHLIRELHVVRIREIKLMRINERLIEQLLNKKTMQEEELQQHVPVCSEARSNEQGKRKEPLVSEQSQFSSMNIADNCYFTIQTYVSFGECGMNLKRTLMDWYENTSSYFNSDWWDDFVEVMKNEDENMEE